MQRTSAASEMNKRQKRVLLVWMVAVAVLGFIWVPTLRCDASRSPIVPECRSTGHELTLGEFHPNVHIARSLAEILVVTLLAGGLLLYFKESE